MEKDFWEFLAWLEKFTPHLQRLERWARKAASMWLWPLYFVLAVNWYATSYSDAIQQADFRAQEIRTELAAVFPTIVEEECWRENRSSRFTQLVFVPTSEEASHAQEILLAVGWEKAGEFGYERGPVERLEFSPAQEGGVFLLAGQVYAFSFEETLGFLWQRFFSFYCFLISLYVLYGLYSRFRI